MRSAFPGGRTINAENAAALAKHCGFPVPDWAGLMTTEMVNDLGRLEGRDFLAPIARGNPQVHWPEGNAIIRRGVVEALGGAPDYNCLARVEKV